MGQYCNCNQLSGLGEITDAEATLIIKEELLKDSAAIVREAVTGKFDTMTAATKRAVERICIKGMQSKAEDFVKTYWWALAIAAGLVLWLIFRK